MTGELIAILASEGLFDGKKLQGKIFETHISWVILSRRNAFKIKKPIKLPYLDYSTLSKRKGMAEYEVELNRRFSDIYKGIVAIRRDRHGLSLGHGNGVIIDYAVHMKRLATSKRLDLLLKSRKITGEDIYKLAKKISGFHNEAQIVSTPFNIGAARKLFNDISGILRTPNLELEYEFTEIIGRSVKWSNKFLANYKTRFRERIAAGFTRDLHGDLHSANIFLYEEPVLFDCIEFNDAFRRIDVLYEIAFLAMEFDHYLQRKQSQKLLHMYLDMFDCMTTPDDEHIFNYYKCLRANVRAKVHAISYSEAKSTRDRSEHLAEIKKYLRLVKRYMTLS